MKIVKRLLRKILTELLWRRKQFIIDVGDEEVFKFIEATKSKVELLQRPHEVFHLVKLLKAVKNIKGDIAEVGVYGGGQL